MPVYATGSLFFVQIFPEVCEKKAFARRVFTSKHTCSIVEIVPDLSGCLSRSQESGTLMARFVSPTPVKGPSSIFTKVGERALTRLGVRIRRREATYNITYARLTFEITMCLREREKDKKGLHGRE